MSSIPFCIFLQLIQLLFRWLAQPLALMAVLVVVSRWLWGGAQTMFIGMHVTDWLFFNSDHRLGFLCLIPHLPPQLNAALLQHVIQDGVGTREPWRVQVWVTALLLLLLILLTTPSHRALRLLFDKSRGVPFLSDWPRSRMAAPGGANRAVTCRGGGQWSKITRKPWVKGTMGVPAGHVEEAVIMGRLNEDAAVGLAIGLQYRRTGCPPGLLGQLLQAVVREQQLFEHIEASTFSCKGFTWWAPRWSLLFLQTPPLCRLFLNSRRGKNVCVIVHCSRRAHIIQTISPIRAEASLLGTGAWVLPLLLFNLSRLWLSLHSSTGIIGSSLLFKQLAEEAIFCYDLCRPWFCFKVLLIRERTRLLIATRSLSATGVLRHGWGQPHLLCNLRFDLNVQRGPIGTVTNDRSTRALLIAPRCHLHTPPSTATRSIFAVDCRSSWACSKKELKHRAPLQKVLDLWWRRRGFLLTERCATAWGSVGERSGGGPMDWSIEPFQEGKRSTGIKLLTHPFAGGDGRGGRSCATLSQIL